MTTLKAGSSTAIFTWKLAGGTSLLHKELELAVQEILYTHKGDVQF